MTETLWTFQREVSQEKINNLADVLNIDKNLAKLLVMRGIESFEEARKFFRPQLDDLYNPFLMKNMDFATDRLKKAVENNEKILIFGDYDVDGTTATALLYLFLKEKSENVSFYIPDRYSEGYGVSMKGIDYAIENNINLIITVDCGIKANKQIEKAQNANIDCIVCDHHEPGFEIPPAIAVLDAKQKDCKYPYKELSGCGVAFKLLQGFCSKTNLDPNIYLFNLLDIVVVSIASDIVPITDENRTLAYYGLQLLNGSPSVGLKNLKKFTQIQDKELQINDIVFKIAPRINAAGRMDSGEKAVKLLISENDDEAEKICMEIEKFNNDRKNIEEIITQQAIEMINSDDKFMKASSTVVYSEEWSKGVVGIVASRLIESFYRPTIVFAKSGDKISGSARSIKGFNLYKAIEYCEDLLENFGGHFYAAGITIKEENLEKFKIRFEEYVKNNILEEQLNPSLSIDTEINFQDITPKFCRLLKQLAPFGPENMSPLFVSNNVKDNTFGKIIGKNNEHLKLQLMQNDNHNLCFDAIAFGYGEFFEKINKSQKFSVCYHIAENEFLNQISIQLLIKDIHFN
ncbi:MAG: single-stranded-DNA-specific exonuclease RecJ [Bacteroidales bacterium]|jgi:single-stranded-DNA-specific exonuclease|nr:single-stranded-DNA-specific exonuclease RecJ [Bacteroidales bacterium]